MTKRPKDLFGHPVRPPREDAIHAAIIEYLCVAAHPRTLWWHCPNGAMMKPSTRIYFARLGVLPGVADLCFVLPDKTSAFMEVKPPGGKLSPAQQHFQARCAVLGLRYRIVYSVTDAEEALKEWKALRSAREDDGPVILNWREVRNHEPDAAA